MRPLEPTTSKQRVVYGLAFFVLFVAQDQRATNSMKKARP